MAAPTAGSQFNGTERRWPESTACAAAAGAPMSCQGILPLTISQRQTPNMYAPVASEYCFSLGDKGQTFKSETKRSLSTPPRPVFPFVRPVRRRRAEEKDRTEVMASESESRGRLSTENEEDERKNDCAALLLVEDEVDQVFCTFMNHKRRNFEPRKQGNRNKERGRGRGRLSRRGESSRGVSCKSAGYMTRQTTRRCGDEGAHVRREGEQTSVTDEARRGTTIQGDPGRSRPSASQQTGSASPQPRTKQRQGPAASPHASAYRSVQPSCKMFTRSQESQGVITCMIIQ